MRGENILQTLQKYATIAHWLDELADKFTELRTTLAARVDKLEAQVTDLRDRVTRLEASRDADRAQAQADLARFLAEVERAEMRLKRLLAPGDAGDVDA